MIPCPVCKSDFHDGRGYILSLELRHGDQSWTYEENVCSEKCGKHLMGKVQDALGDILMTGDIEHVS